jgi:hypothetical protein
MTMCVCGAIERRRAAPRFAIEYALSGGEAAPGARAERRET